MRKDDWVRLRHMLDAAREAREFAAGKSRNDLDSNRQLVLSLVKCIEIVGEAATRVSPQERNCHPSIPWQDVISMRNRLIHAYFDINLDVLWDTVTDDLPPLLAELERICAAYRE